jgi:hypothetical protein
VSEGSFDGAAGIAFGVTTATRPGTLDETAVGFGGFAAGFEETTDPSPLAYGRTCIVGQG